MKIKFHLLLNYLTIAIFGATGCTSEDIEYRIMENELKITAKIHSKTIPIDSLILDSFKIIDLDSDHSYNPYLRLWGIGQIEIDTDIIKVDEYLEGWFLLNNDEIALVFISEHTQAIYFQTVSEPPGQVQVISKVEDPVKPENRKYYSILLGTDDPKSLMQRMEQTWGVTVQK